MHIITEHPDDPKFPTFHYKCDFMDYVANSGVLLFKHLLDIYLVSQRANCAGCEDKEKNFIKIKKKKHAGQGQFLSVCPSTLSHYKKPVLSVLNKNSHCHNMRCWRQSLADQLSQSCSQ